MGWFGACGGRIIEGGYMGFYMLWMCVSMYVMCRLGMEEIWDSVRIYGE